jgi:hypothetical protein
MPELALIVSQSGRVTHGLPALVSARGCDPVETLVTDRPEDGRYYLAPGTVERVERRTAGAEREPPVLVVDGTVHPGQAVDLRARLPSVTVRDRRELLWERLAERNPVAATRTDKQRPASGPPAQSPQAVLPVRRRRRRGRRRVLPRPAVPCVQIDRSTSCRRFEAAWSICSSISNSWYQGTRCVIDRSAESSS